MLKNNKVNLIISILGAIVIWSYVMIVVNPFERRVVQNIPVELASADVLSKDGLVVSSDVPPLVSVRVEGPRSKVNNLTVRDVKASVNLTGMKKGSNKVEVAVAITDDEVKKLEISPAEIYVNVEEMITVTKPIQLDYTKPFPDGQEPGFFDITPQEIEVAGTKEKVGEVSHIRAIVNSDDLGESPQTQTIIPEAVNKDGERVSGVSLSRDAINIKATLCMVKTVPLKVSLINNFPSGAAVTTESIPDTVSIRGAKDAIGDVNMIQSAEIDLSRITETTVIVPTLDLPKGVELAEASRDLTFEFGVEGEESRSFEYTAEQIRIKGVPKDVKVHVNTGIIKVIVMAPGSEIKEITQKDILPYVTLTEADLSKESADLTVEFEYDNRITRVISNPSAVHVIINDSLAISKNTTSTSN
jgi:YbbR domain-containing protein